MRQAFSLVPEYLRTAEGTRGVRNLMDTGVQLGRRFRVAEAVDDPAALRGGRAFARCCASTSASRSCLPRGWTRDDDFERVAPVPFSVVCFRARPRGPGVTGPEIDDFNKRLLDAVNASGDVFLSHTRVGDQLVLRLAIGHLRTTERHVARAWALLREQTAQLAVSSSR